MERTMVRRLSAWILCLFIVLGGLPLFSGCSSAPPLEDMVDRVIELIEHSYEVNVFLFGEGLPVYARGSELAEARYVYQNETDATYATYDAVMPVAGFHTIDEMKIRAQNVYCLRYLAALYETAFEGLVYEWGGDSQMVAPARYSERNGELQQQTDHQPLVTGRRIYDYATMTYVGRQNATQVRIRMDTYKAGDQNVLPVTLTLVYEDGDWYLNSPTY